MAEHDDLGEQWRAANRVPAGVVHTDASRELMDELRARIVNSDQSSRKAGWRPRLPFARRGVALASVIGGLLLVGGAAAATLAITYATDGTPGSCQTLATATANIAFPAEDRAWRNWVLLESINPELGMTLHQACDDPAREYARGRAIESVRVFRGEVAQSAFCAWASDWLTAKRSDDAPAASRAAAEIATAIPWPAANKNAERNRVSWFVPTQRAVRAGNVATVASMWEPTGHGAQVYQCWVYQPPADSDNGTVFVSRPREYAKS